MEASHRSRPEVVASQITVAFSPALLSRLDSPDVQSEFDAEGLPVLVELIDEDVPRLPIDAMAIWVTIWESTPAVLLGVLSNAAWSGIARLIAKRSSRAKGEVEIVLHTPMITMKATVSGRGDDVVATVEKLLSTAADQVRNIEEPTADERTPRLPSREGE